MSENDSKANILMVDDQPAKLLSYEAILEELDLNLIKVSSGREALERLLKADIAVVLWTSACRSWTAFSWRR